MKDKDLIGHFDKKITAYKGYIPTLESAIGAYVIGRRFGWKVLYLVHDKKTVRKYEEILGVRFREVLPEEGDQSNRALCYRLQKKASNFWKAVSGELKVTYKGQERSVRDKWVGTT